MTRKSSKVKATWGGMKMDGKKRDFQVRYESNSSKKRHIFRLVRETVKRISCTCEIMKLKSDTDLQ